MNNQNDPNVGTDPAGNAPGTQQQTPTPDPTNNPAGSAKTPDGQGNNPETRLFTQDDVNRIVSARLTEERGKEEWAAYQAWKAAQADKAPDPEGDKKPDADDKKPGGDGAAEPPSPTEEILRAQVAALKLNANPDTLDDVITLALARTSETKGIDKAIEEVLKQYPHFTAATTKEPPAAGKTKPPGLLFPQDNKPLATGTHDYINQLFRQKKGG